MEHAQTSLWNKMNRNDSPEDWIHWSHSEQGPALPSEPSCPCTAGRSLLDSPTLAPDRKQHFYFSVCLFTWSIVHTHVLPGVGRLSGKCFPPQIVHLVLYSTGPPYARSCCKYNWSLQTVKQQQTLLLHIGPCTIVIILKNIFNAFRVMMSWVPSGQCITFVGKTHSAWWGTKGLLGWGFRVCWVFAHDRQHSEDSDAKALDMPIHKCFCQFTAANSQRLLCLKHTRSQEPTDNDLAHRSRSTTMFSACMHAWMLAWLHALDWMAKFERLTLTTCKLKRPKTQAGDRSGAL